MNLKEYANMSIVDFVIQYYLWKIFGTDFFADMLTSDNFFLNKYTALQMRQYLDTKLNKLNPNHIENVMIEFKLPPTPDVPIGLYFAKQKKMHLTFNRHRWTYHRSVSTPSSATYKLSHQYNHYLTTTTN